MTLTLTRHGETDANAAGLVQGRGMDPDLNAAGRAQAEAIARRLAGVRLDAVYTSTQRRSQQTAEPVLAGHPGAALVVRAGLDEMDWGVHEGHGFTAASGDTATTAAYDTLVGRWSRGETDVPVEGGESPREVAERVRPVLAEIAAAYPDGNVLVVSHRRLLRVLLASVMPGGGLERMQQFAHGNAALTTLDVPAGAFAPGGPPVRAVVVADVSHLAPA